MHIRFSIEPGAETVVLSDSVYADLDEAGEPVGFEVLRVEPSLRAKTPASPAMYLCWNLIFHTGH